jgi:hypothetical protein
MIYIILLFLAATTSNLLIGCASVYAQVFPENLAKVAPREAPGVIALDRAETTLLHWQRRIKYPWSHNRATVSS